MAALAPVVATESVELFGHVLASRAFAVGLVFGALAYFASGVIAAARHTTNDGAGIVFAAALVLAVRDVFGAAAAPAGFVAGLVLLAVGGAVAARARPRVATAWYVSFLRTGAALLPGVVVLVAVFPVHDPTWVRLAVGASVLIATPLVHDYDATHGARGAPFLLLLVSALAVYYTVPDTELPLVLLGCCIPLALLSVPQPLRRLGPAGTAAAIGVYAWVVVVGGRGRAGSVIAGIAALGILVVEPLARRVPRSTTALGKKRRQRTRRSDTWLLVIGVAAIAQVALGMYCAKIAGRESDTTLAALMTAPALVLLGGAAPYLTPILTAGRRGPHNSHKSSRHAGHHHRSRPTRSR
jgi:hypothetical protein